MSEQPTSSSVASIGPSTGSDRRPVDRSWRRVSGAIRGAVGDDRGGVSAIAGMAAMTIGVLAAAGIVVGVMMDHARAVPGPSGSGGAVVGGR